MSSTNDTIKQLNNAREIVLKDAAIYPQVVPGVLPVIGRAQPVELRRWGADFLAETFASPVLSAEEKQKMCLSILDTLNCYLNRKEEMGEEEDTSVVKAAIQCAASIYPLVFRHTIENREDSETWAKMAGMKGSILRRMDTAPAGARICCIKFVARVVQVQTPGLIADPRRPDQNEVSLALVPRDHPILPPSNLEAEASGLLDRLLGVLQENIEDALIATATLNALPALVQRRASISTKIISTVLSFNPLRLANSTKPTNTTSKDKVVIKSMTRTTMSFLLNVLKRNPTHTLAGRIQQQVERLRYTLTEVFFDQANQLKRSAPDEPIDGLDENKRRRLDTEVENGTTPLQQQQPQAPPLLPRGPVSYAQLYTLNSDPKAAGFHVEAIPLPIVAQLVPAIFARVDGARLDEATTAVQARYLQLQQRPPHGNLDVPGADDEDDDYDPTTGFGDAEQTLNRLDQMPPEGGAVQEVAIGTFTLPPPPPLSEQEKMEYGESAKERLFAELERFDDALKKNKGRKVPEVDAEREKGFNRGIGAVQGREGWITLLIRVETRASFGLDDENGKVKQEGEDRSIVKKDQGLDLPSRIRDALQRYVLDDWRRRIDIAISWLNEEWYADKLQAKRHPTSPDQEPLPTYNHLVLSFLDSLLPYIDTKDGRPLVRFLSEIPSLPPQAFERIQRLAEDPERVQLSTQALLYLIMLRPPVRESAIECAVQMWRGNKEARAAVGKVLKKWRPEVLEEGITGNEDGEQLKREG